MSYQSFKSQVIELLEKILAKEYVMAETIESVSAKLDSIGTSITDVVKDIGELKAEIDELKAGTVTQEQLDALGAKAANIAAAAQAAADIVKP